MAEEAFVAKMKAEGLQQAFIDGWMGLYSKLKAGDKGMIPEADISPVTEVDVAKLEELKPASDTLLKETVVLKLNGGLGTGMGLDKAKSLLEVKGGDTFLDLIAKQVLQMREKFPVRFMLMNSFSTEDDTKAFFAKYPEIHSKWEEEVAFMQNKSPKVLMSDLSPGVWPEKNSCEWCPPGHGDIYAALVCSGKLEKLIKDGYKYMFVSNSDNLGATLDMRILGHLAESGAPMLMEVCVRGEDDKKGGHLAKDKKNGGLLLRESAQCPAEDEKEFQNVNKYKFFNTNNLWVDLEALKAQFDKHGGSLPLPVMMNSKTVDPRDKKSTKVIQLETAMGAAISCFPGAQALVIPRSRFAPVKTTGDLFALRSDAYLLTPDFRITLAEARAGVPPTIKLDDKYKFVDAMETLIPNGPPSLIGCKKLVVEGAVVFEKGVVIKGTVTVKGGSDAPKVVKAGTYTDTTLTL